MSRTTLARSPGRTEPHRTTGLVARIWVGADIGKTHHHCVVLNAEGERL
ncbi:hypothetical protein [Streptomyces sp. WAC05858]